MEGRPSNGERRDEVEEETSPNAILLACWPRTGIGGVTKPELFRQGIQTARMRAPYGCGASVFLPNAAASGAWSLVLVVRITESTGAKRAKNASPKSRQVCSETTALGFLINCLSARARRSFSRVLGCFRTTALIFSKSEIRLLSSGARQPSTPTSQLVGFPSMRLLCS